MPTRPNICNYPAAIPSNSASPRHTMPTRPNNTAAIPSASAAASGRAAKRTVTMDVLADPETFVKEFAAMKGLTDIKKYTETIVKAYGSVEHLMELVRHNFETSEEASRQLVASGNALMVGRKPIHGEDVFIVKLDDKVSFRYWDGGLESMSLFCFDFVHTHNPSRYMLTPKYIKIELLGTLGYPEAEIHSISTWLKGGSEGTVWYSSKALNPNGIDQNDETYVIEEGSHLRVRVGSTNYHDVRIPTRERHGFSPVQHIKFGL